MARNELEEISWAAWGEEFGGYFVKLPFEVVNEFRSRVDALEEGAVFWE